MASMPKTQRFGATAPLEQARRGQVVQAIGWALLAWFFLLVVFALNGEPLFYYDTAGYFDAGVKILRTLGLFQPQAVAGVSDAATAVPDGTVVGSRSAVYALIAAIFLQLHALWALVLLQAAALVLGIHLVCRLVTAQTGPPALAWPATAAAALAGALGSAGFFSAYLMPDIFAAILLLSIAGLAAFAPDLRWGGALALLALGALAVVTHPSHLAIALMAVPGVALACLAFGARRWWLSVLLVALIAATGLLERKAFVVTVENKTSQSVVYLPFFTVRLIVDGPGKAYLDETCPKTGGDATADSGAASNVMATCALNAQLTRPEQMQAERMLFATDAATGSFALLSADQRRAIEGEQFAFLKAVALSRPLAVFAAAMGNTFAQLGMAGIDMTLPDAGMIDSAHKIYPDFPDTLKQGNLTGGAWVATLTRLQEVYYALTGLALIALLVLPQSHLPRRVRLFGVLVLLGIFANAFVTGAISQPASRYGARVIFLIPLVLTLLAMSRPGKESRP